ncbi:hypothetical protein L6164_014306 [Bauhinia variegata]|uniref:Uncharacterized protein n=1 Tax=Bauhinia variegata TaxID=167791 RepID=A0ACB9NIK4_BAUVA|nr:hypothetical protein L6164_014306 [Bauhinia variegata]
MNLLSFKLDIDELINEFSANGSTTLADMKRVWLSKRFSYIYEAGPSTNLAFFMQSLFDGDLNGLIFLGGYMVDNNASLSHRLGGLYCLYCLYETQPFKPPFRVYLSLGELKKLRELAVDVNYIKVVPALVKRMLERNMFLFGAVDLKEGSVAETVNQLQELQKARLEVAYEKLFGDTKVEEFIHMDIGVEVDLNALKKISSEYAEAKNIAIREASNVIDVQNIKHISEEKKMIGGVVEKIADDWQVQKESFYKQTGLGDDEGYGQVLEQLLLTQDDGETDQDDRHESQ